MIVVGMKKFCVLGPFHSGTNLIAKIVSHKYRYCRITYKHSISDINIDPDVMYIIMYKNVYNWMASIKKESYEIRFRNGFYDPIEYQKRNFENLLALYHEYYRNYRELLQKYPTQMICIDYYQLIQGKKGFEYLNLQLQKIGCPPLQDSNHFLLMLSMPSKLHGKSVQNSTEALLKQNTNRVLYQKEIHHHLSHEIDQDLYDFFDSCTSISRDDRQSFHSFSGL